MEGVLQRSSTENLQMRFFFSFSWFISYCSSEAKSVWRWKIRIDKDSDSFPDSEHRSCYSPCDNIAGPATCDTAWSNAIDLRSASSFSETDQSSLRLWPSSVASRTTFLEDDTCPFLGKFDVCVCPDGTVRFEI